MESDGPKEKKLHSIQLSKYVINSIADWRNRKQLCDERWRGMTSYVTIHDEEFDVINDFVNNTVYMTDSE